MFHRTLTLLSLVTGIGGAHVQAQTPSYPPFRDYSMPRDAELALARTAAPSTITDHATLKIHPHVMIFAPGYTNDMVGGNAFGSVLPQLSDDAATPFAVVVIPVDQSLAIKGNGARQ